ncbi:hypothetical protein HMPREF3181_00715 [Parvimonas sp. KA00067]|uniref:Exosortase n=1 Tax=Parvimonas parva TaxID=2769485 RepID=A0ABS1C753_9FIRM|nr:MULTISPECIES: hypothetical protein [Parvimonas]KXB66497.1 hypothetical protein HMPREF3181_00715 [Parvimonas sp. KA00067]MBK1467885.1 hypothetical protein [Parvimonas parva]
MKNKCKFKNYYLPIGAIFLSIALILKRYSNINDIVLGFLFGISIGLLLLSGLYKIKK